MVDDNEINKINEMLVGANNLVCNRPLWGIISPTLQDLVRCLDLITQQHGAEVERVDVVLNKNL